MCCRASKPLVIIPFPFTLASFHWFLWRCSDTVIKGEPVKPGEVEM